MGPPPVHRARIRPRREAAHGTSRTRPATAARADGAPFGSSPRSAAQRRTIERLIPPPAENVAQRVQINHANANPDIPFPFDTANVDEAVSIIRSLAVEQDDTNIIQIYSDLKAHVAAPPVLPLPAADAQLLNWLRPIAIAAKKVAPLQANLDNAAPNKTLTQISEVSRRIALTSGGLLASGAVLNLDTAINWFTTPPQTNVVFGSLTFQSPASNYSLHTPGLSAEVSLTDPESNRTFQGYIDIPDRQSQILGGGQSTNISQNPLEVPQGTQNFHSFALVATSLLGAITLGSTAVWWLTKPSQSTLDQLKDLSEQRRRLWETILELAQTRP